MDAFLGKYKLVSQDNFDAYLKALGMSLRGFNRISFIKAQKIRCPKLLVKLGYKSDR